MTFSPMLYIFFYFLAEFIAQFNICNTTLIERVISKAEGWKTFAQHYL